MKWRLKKRKIICVKGLIKGISLSIEIKKRVFFLTDWVIFLLYIQ